MSNKLLLCILIPSVMLAVTIGYIRYVDWSEARKKRKRDRMAIMTREYDDIRASIALCFHPTHVEILYQRISNFEHRSMNVLPHELHIRFCNNLEELLDKKIEWLNNNRNKRTKFF